MGATAPGEAWLLGLADFDSVSWGSSSLGICIGPVRGFSLIVFRKRYDSNIDRNYISVAGTDESHVWCFDSWSNSFKSVDLQGTTPRVLGNAIARVYGVAPQGGIETVTDTVSKGKVTFRLP